MQAFEKAKASKKAAAQKNATVSANALTKHALRILDLAGFHVWRQNNAAVFDPKRKVFRSNSATPGISDIIGFNRKTGQFIACEIKVGKDKLSTDQEMFLDRINRCGGVAFVAHSIEDLEQFLKKVKSAL
ncbi:VRR-NUC domain-containing protein [Nostoc ellipsosporum NOK]|nr:VRR-NUC domain-containing protein [Nostoc ellipsosporum NOK]